MLRYFVPLDLFLAMSHFCFGSRYAIGNYTSKVSYDIPLNQIIYSENIQAFVLQEIVSLDS